MRLLSTCAAAAALALLASAGTASAEDATVTVNVAVTSDYVFRGFSQTNEDPAFQAGFDITKGSFYVGGWASNVDFGNDTVAETDVYGGYRTEVAGFAVDVGLIGYGYIKTPDGAGEPYVEAKAAVSRAFGPVTAGVAVYYSPDFFGAADSDDATYVELNGAYTVLSNLTVSAAVGEQYLAAVAGDDYTTWNVGATYTFAGTPLALDVRYHDTDVDSAISEGRVVGTLKAVF
jgi:uncharacterized protein (TIGR02001 family)